MINKSKISFTISIVWALIILIFSAIPGSAIKLPPVWNADKILHLIIYAFLSLFISLGYYYSEKQNYFFRIVIIPVILSVVFGGLTEVLQDYVFIDRHGDYYDFIANSTGAIMASLSFYYIIKLHRK